MNFPDIVYHRYIEYTNGVLYNFVLYTIIMFFQMSPMLARNTFTKNKSCPIKFEKKYKSFIFTPSIMNDS